MEKFTNPLNKIRVASPCPADWNEMHGDERKRHCSECNLNVYNLSDMTKQEAEKFLINSEGRVCVKFYRRRDGTVLTKDCPVGWAKLKKRVSRVATAVFASAFGLLTGLFAFHQTETDPSELVDQVVVEADDSLIKPDEPVMGEPVFKDAIMGKPVVPAGNNKGRVVGRIERFRELKDEPVVAWIQ